MQISELSLPLTSCRQCGGSTAIGESCADRFQVLLALDHSRQEPWGSRHGLAFAAYTLQHSADVAIPVLQNSWLMLSRVYEFGDARQDVVNGIRATYRSRHDATYSKGNRPRGETWRVSELPARTKPPQQFAVTIANLGEFPAESYAAMLDTWCLATLNAWKTDDASDNE